MPGSTLRIENSTRAHAESLHVVLADYEARLVQDGQAWQVQVQVGELASLLVSLFEALGSWLETEQVDSVLVRFDERQFTLLRPSPDRLIDSNAFLLERVAQLETALQTRIVLEQAKGILALTLGYDPEQAFETLRAAARDHGATLRDLAARIVAAPAEARQVLASP